MIKCHKIRDVDMDVCTCEQKIAYNFAFMWADVGKSILAKDAPAYAKAEAMQGIYNNVLDSVMENDRLSKYNIDAIMIAFRQGFENYCNNHFIAASYESIGKVFAIPYAEAKNKPRQC